MKVRRGTYKHIDDLRQSFEHGKDAIRRRLAEFEAVRPDDYFYELVYCLLTPQSSAVNAAKAVEALRHSEARWEALPPSGILFEKAHYIRFHNTKARHIVAARLMFPEIRRHLCNGSTSIELRAWLVKNVKGLGWKEASHFLRNIGHRDLAILDRHILRNLKRHGVIRSLPRALTPKRYQKIEGRFSLFARSVGITMDELDLLFWSRETGEILK
jgi:N-glycosylase/DNA lyase